ncbi:SMP-30/gluconolactonase/LRE family protein [Mycobacterium spongiae]|uniref:SMP-30/gluconolactonase/LRE family protein n=1 Tax=Mycobacterium spongiae TaxID=886343 RepID=A0A975K2X2_9MYCO|nr:SMP-30/gluconolactonase/LRE family protein [Mycobacterium spongiae]QUR69770.1 SMP-30/gluconolactonase/LRE family protein [Mycobacterium spongiae]
MRPAKPPLRPVRWQPPPSKPLPQPDLQHAVTVVGVPGYAPEDVVVDGGGNVWTGVDDGRLLRIAGDGAEVQVVADTGGRPLGLAVGHDGRILVCDSHRGLLRCDPKTGKLETLVSDVAGRPLMLCSNVIESTDGTIYFTESTDRFGYENYKGAVLEARGGGSLFRRDTDGTVDVLASGLNFANGVMLTDDESAVVFAESMSARLSKYWLTGDRAGSITELVTELPGYPDNIALGSDGRVWAALVSERNRLSEWLSPRAPTLRKLLWRLPYRWMPDPKSTVWAIAFDPDDGRVLAQLHTVHPAFGLVTGVAEAQGRLWLGCIGAPAVGCIDL